MCTISGLSETQVVYLPFDIGNNLFPRPAFLPPAIPSSIAETLTTVHGNPEAWWFGQFAKYLFRMQPATHDLIKTASQKLNFKKPVVG